jgi:CheY-like chemotaxis protein
MKKILFIDDEELITKLAKKMLGKLGYEITTRNNSIEALELFLSDPGAFDLVITDMSMPEMTGDHLGQKIIQARPNIPVMIKKEPKTWVSDTILQSRWP